MRKFVSLLLLSVLALSANAEQTKRNILGFHDNSEGSPIVSMIDAAAESVDIEIYEMEDANVLKAIRSALDRGVRVQVVQEPAPMGAHCKLFSGPGAHDDANCAAHKSLVAEVRAKNGRYEPFNKALCGKHHSCFQHGKIVIIDSKLVLLSSGNFNPTNLCDLDQNPHVCNRDYSFVTDDADVTSTIKSIFEKDLEAAVYDVAGMLSGEASEKMTVSPVSLHKIIEFIDSAESTLQIQNQYLHENTINAALVRAAKKGVQVEVTVSSVCFFEKPKPHAADKTRETFSGFDDAGISSKFFTKNVTVKGKPGYLHAKAIVVDGKRAWMGSMNGSDESANMNREYGIFFDNPAWVKKLSGIMKADHGHAGSETWQESLDCVQDHQR